MFRTALICYWGFTQAYAPFKVHKGALGSWTVRYLWCHNSKRMWESGRSNYPYLFLRESSIEVPISQHPQQNPESTGASGVLSLCALPAQQQWAVQGAAAADKSTWRRVPCGLSTEISSSFWGLGISHPVTGGDPEKTQGDPAAVNTRETRGRKQ